MKRLITTALIVACSFAAVHAQNTTTPAPRPHAHKQGKFAGDELNLTEDQKARMKSIRENHRKQLEDLKKQDKLSEAERTKRRDALQQKFKAEYESVLTSAQKQQLAKNKEAWKENKAEWKDRKGERKGDRKEGRGPGMGDGRFQRGQLPEELGLSADQKQKVAAIHQQYRPRMEALRNDASLSQDQKRSKLEDLRKQQQEQVKKVLTAEQNQKMENLRKQKAARNL
ncbi:hypothetical protein V9K67_06985 [Paraflavisolibacter sp. H34]|uniref:hypothetical protein n=1 Tax=Huijunlia imazamoxiresistens TaxID=3127457 RepID=UPI0030198106